MKLQIYEIIEGKDYRVTYPKKEHLICKVLYKYSDGDCDVIYKNGRTATWHCHWLEKI